MRAKIIQLATAAALVMVVAAVAMACAGTARADYSAFYGFPGNGSESPPLGAEPSAGLTPFGGAFYGTTTRGGSGLVNGFGGGVVFKLVNSSKGSQVTVLHAFTGDFDGIFPGSGDLVIDAKNNIYGTTNGWAEFINEGIPGCGPNQNIGCDTVFMLSPNGKSGWTWRLLHRFAGGGDGYDPQGGLLLNEKTGVIYGTTMFGGNRGCSQQQPPPMLGCGTVFALSGSAKGWTKTILHTFTGGADGGLPAAALIADPSGNGVLYGTASSGGKVSNVGNICNFGAYCGVVFMLTPTATVPWKLTVLHYFTGGSDGAGPVAALAMKGGILYGTASAGGDYNGYGCGASGGGSVFALALKTLQFSTLYNFKCGGDGGVPLGNVALDAAGNVYGTTSNDGNLSHGCAENIGCGTVFKLTRQTLTPWPETRLHIFAGTTDGGQSEAGLTLVDGVLFGTVRLGVDERCSIDPFTPGCGGLFAVTP